MTLYSKLRPLSANLVSAKWLFFLSAIVTWPIMAELELFEQFHEFSRAHEDWDVDEFALLILNLTIALLVSTMHQSRVLKKLARERAFEHQRAERNAHHDPLTGLLNRRAFSIELEKAEKRSQIGDQRVIAMIDLDRFKPVNDLQGHAAGDATLREVAERLEHELPNATVARLGGDEFAVIFNNEIDVGHAERTSRRLLLAISQPFDFNGTQLVIGCSIGLAHWKSSLSASEALSHADKALYLAKTQGRGRFAWYDAELDQRSTARAEIEVDLRIAIKNSDIKPWFQPIADIQSGRFIGFEVLARWNHPTLENIEPSEFIEIAEDSGQISELGDSILRQACIAANDWDPNISISVNISPLQFHDPRLVQNIKSILQDCRFDPERLTLEVTESSVIQDFEIARQKLEALKVMGIAVALDDFGTGFSSLSSLRQIPFDRIKIDRSFVTNISSQPQNQKIVSGIMALANGLELDVTAEGIESLEDLTYLQEQYCSLGQGFYFEKAIPAEKVPWLLDTQNPATEILGQQNTNEVREA